MKAALGLASALALAGGASLSMSAERQTPDDGMSQLGQNFYGCADGQNAEPTKLSTVRVSCGQQIPVQTVFVSPE